MLPQGGCTSLVDNLNKNTQVSTSERGADSNKHFISTPPPPLQTFAMINCHFIVT